MINPTPIKKNPITTDIFRLNLSAIIPVGISNKKTVTSRQVPIIIICHGTKLAISIWYNKFIVKTAVVARANINLSIL